MKVFSLESASGDFLHHVASKKRDFKDWFFLHVKIDEGEQSIKLGEVLQSLRFVFAGEESYVLEMTKHNEVFVVSGNVQRKALSMYEKTAKDHFGDRGVHVISNTLSNKGVEQLIKLISVHEEDLQDAAVSALKRLGRACNVFIVLDDDVIVLKQMQKILQGFGHVEATHDPEQFIDLYKQYAPNVAFLDVHLKGERGTNVLNSLIKDVDPHAYVVMISSDSLKNTVLESKHKGASGYIMKPFERDLVYKNLLKAPTFVPYVEHV